MVTANLVRDALGSASAGKTPHEVAEWTIASRPGLEDARVATWVDLARTWLER